MKIKYVFYSLFINTTLIILFLEVNKSKKADFIFNLFNIFNNTTNGGVATIVSWILGG
jgi:hypothetical protein